MKTLNQIETELKEIEAARNGELTVLLEKINTAETERKAAEEAAEAAYDSANVDEYHRQRANARRQEDLRNMNQRRYDALSALPLIDKDTYEKYCSEVMQTLDEESDATRLALYKALNKTISIADKHGQNIEYGNNILHFLQYTLMREDENFRTQGGAIVLATWLQKKYTRLDEVTFANNIRAMPYYEYMKGFYHEQ